MNEQQITLSIIIVNWNVRQLLNKCLKSIFKFADDLKIEVIVIDNDSGDGTVEMVQQNFPQVQLTASQVNLGFAKANNLGLNKPAAVRFYC